MKKTIVLLSVLLVIVVAILAILTPSILLHPLVTPSEYLAAKPFVDIELFGRSFVVIVPSSTIIVFLLGFQVIYLGTSFLQNRQDSRQLWWGIAMLFWGLGTLSAGFSYQGLGYELKCAGNEYCMFTSFPELFYLLLN